MDFCVSNTRVRKEVKTSEKFGISKNIITNKTNNYKILTISTQLQPLSTFTREKDILKSGANFHSCLLTQ